MPQTFEVDPYVSNKNEKVTFYHVDKCSNGKNLLLTFHQAKAVAVKSKAQWRQKRGDLKFSSVSY